VLIHQALGSTGDQGLKITPSSRKCFEQAGAEVVVNEKASKDAPGRLRDLAPGSTRFSIRDASVLWRPSIWMPIGNRGHDPDHECMATATA